MVDIRAFGASTARTDNDVALNAAIAAIGGVGSIEVCETYFVSAPTVLPNGTALTITGDKGVSRLKAADGSGQFPLLYAAEETVLSSLKLVGIAFDGNRPLRTQDYLGAGLQSGAPVILDGGSTNGTPNNGTLHVEDVEVINWGSYASGFSFQGWKRAKFRDGECSNSGWASESNPLFHGLYGLRNGIVTADNWRCYNIGGGSGIKVQAGSAATQATITKCPIDLVAGRGIFLSDDCDGTVIGNRISRATTFGIVASPSSGTLRRGLVITGNTIKDMRGADGAGIAAIEYEDAIITGNRLENFGWQGINAKTLTNGFIGDNVMRVTTANVSEYPPIAIYCEGNIKGLRIGANNFFARSTTVSSMTWLRTTAVNSGSDLLISDKQVLFGDGCTIQQYNLKTSGITYTYC
jgi:hypothetical protein